MADPRLHESGGPDGGTRGGYIDSFENMPGAQHQPFGAKPPKAFVPRIGPTLIIAAWPDATWLDPGTSVTGLMIDIWVDDAAPYTFG